MSRLGTAGTVIAITAAALLLVSCATEQTFATLDLHRPDATPVAYAPSPTVTTMAAPTPTSAPTPPQTPAPTATPTRTPRPTSTDWRAARQHVTETAAATPSRTPVPVPWEKARAAGEESAVRLGLENFQADEVNNIITAVNPKDHTTYVYVPAGEFLMGSPLTEPDAGTREHPLHLLYLDEFWISQTEVTRQQYSAYKPKSVAPNALS